MNFVDTHTHLYLKQFNNDRDEVVRRALDAGVTSMYLPNVDSGTIDAMLELEAAHPAHCHAMMGLHPCSVGEDFEQELTLVRDWLDRRPFCAVGEIGIDLYWDKTFFDQQKEAFRIQTNWAKELGLPIVIHSRESTDVLIELVGELKDERLKGVFHCFTGNADQARIITGELGFFLGIGGVVTFKNGGMDRSLPAVDPDWLVLETDAPYLAPVPHRGKRNESAYVVRVAEKLAEIYALPLAEIARRTTDNAHQLYGPRSAFAPGMTKEIERNTEGRQ